MAPGRFATCMASCPRLMDLGWGFHWSLSSGTRSSTRRVACASCSSSWTMSLTVIMGSSTDQCMDVTVGILEPGGFHASAFVNLTLECQPRQGIVLEVDALCIESLYDFLHVVSDDQVAAVPLL